MAITLVGSPTENSAINGANFTLTLPSGLAENDVVYVFAAGHAYTIGTDIDPSAASWVRLGHRTRASVAGTIFRRKMGATPVTSVDILFTGSDSDDAGAAIAFALRGVDPTTTEDVVNPTSADIIAAYPDSPTITTVTNGAWVFSFFATNATDLTPVAPTGYSNQIDIAPIDVHQLTIAGAAKLVSVAGAENPGAWGGWGGGDGVAFTLAVRPSLTLYELDLDGGSYAVTGTSATLRWAHELAPVSGNFAVTGTAATLTLATKLAVDGGSFAFTGTNINWLISVSSGSFGFTGATANLQFSSAITLSADAGSFAVTGVDASLEYGFEIVPDAGSYLVTGSDVSLYLVAFISADAGSFAFTGENVDLTLATPPAAISLVSHPAAWGPIGGRRDPLSPPLNTEQIGAVLSCTSGVWSSLTGLPLSYSYQWRRDAVDICDAILNAYTLEQADSGAAIDCMVTVTDGAHTEEEDSNNIICETEVFPVRTHYRKVTGMHSGGTLTFTRTIEDAPCDPEPDPDPDPDVDPDPDPGEEGGFIIDANQDFVVDDDSAFLTDASQ